MRKQAPAILTSPHPHGRSQGSTSSLENPRRSGGRWLRDGLRLQVKVHPHRFSHRRSKSFIIQPSITAQYAVLGYHADLMSHYDGVGGQACCSRRQKGLGGIDAPAFTSGRDRKDGDDAQGNVDGLSGDDQRGPLPGLLRPLRRIEINLDDLPLKRRFNHAKAPRQSRSRRAGSPP